MKRTSVVRWFALGMLAGLMACNGGGSVTAPLVPTEGLVAPWAVDSALATPPKADSVITTIPDGIRP